MEDPQLMSRHAGGIIKIKKMFHRDVTRRIPGGAITPVAFIAGLSVREDAWEGGGLRDAFFILLHSRCDTVTSPGVLSGPMYSVAFVAVLAVGEEAREMGELQKAFFILLHAISANELSGVVIAMDSNVLDLLLQALLANAASHSEAGIRRACFQVRIYTNVY